METAIKSAADIEAVLIKLIKEGSPDNTNGVIESKTIPNQDVKGFDSLTALEVLTELEEETGIHVEEDIFYVDVKRTKYRSVQQTALAIWNEIQKGGKTCLKTQIYLDSAKGFVRRGKMLGSRKLKLRSFLGCIARRSPRLKRRAERYRLGNLRILHCSITYQRRGSWVSLFKSTNS